MTGTEDTAATEPQDGVQGTETAATTPEATELPEDATEAEETGNGEAAKYRRRLRETEAERDTLAGRLEAMQRGEVERIAAATVKSPAALWAAGIEVADMLTEDGTVDPAKVRAAASQAADRLGLATPRPPNYVPREGANPAVGARSSGMEQVIMGVE